MTTQRYSLAVIPGDGIGPEVIGESLKLLDAIAATAKITVDRQIYDLGADRYLRTGEVLPTSVLAELAQHDAILFGAMGRPDVPSGILEANFILRLRREFAQYVNLRPVRTVVSGDTGPSAHQRVDLLIVRENIEGLYGGSGGVSYRGEAAEVAIQESVNTRFGVQRLMEYAFRLADKRRRQLTVCHKTNVLAYAGDLWMRVADDVAGRHPSVARDYVHVDAACLHLVKNPERFDVIATDSMFGDILSDLAAGLVGGLGFAGSGNINPTGEYPSMFEPIHGSAPDIVGKGLANPIASFLAVAYMLDHLGAAGAAQAIEGAIDAAVPRLSWDGLRLVSGTAEVSEAVLSALQ